MKTTLQESLAILRRHRELDAISRTCDERRFISGWKTTNPFAMRFIGEAEDSGADVGAYSFLSDSVQLAESISSFHLKADGREYAPESIYITSGSSVLLLSFFLSLGETGIRAVWYAPPIYYTCYYFCQNLGIAMHRLTVGPLNSTDIVLDLPETRIALILTDPIWVFGITVHVAQIEALAAWQRRTGSLILVDGTFQYTKWDPSDSGESTSMLEPDLTFRLVCPTKSLAVHGVRFAYMLVPPQFREAIRYPCANITGATGTTNERYALRLMRTLASAERNHILTAHIQQVHQRLHEDGIIIEEPFTPVASYYTFARLSPDVMSDAVVMDQGFFELDGYDGLVRVNLLNSRWVNS